MFAARIRRLNVATISGWEARLNCRFCGDYLEDQQKLVNLSCSNDIQDTSRLECGDVFSDRIDKLTEIIKLLKRKDGDYTDCVGGEQSSFVTKLMSMLIVLLIRTYLTSCCNDFLSRADRKFTGRNISFLLYGKRPEWNKTMSPAPEKQQNALICNSGPNLNEQRFKNLDISHSDLAFKSIQDFLRVKWVKQRLIWSMIYNRPSFSLFRWIKI